MARWAVSGPEHRRCEIKRPIFYVLGCVASFLLLAIGRSSAQGAHERAPTPIQAPAPSQEETWEQVKSPGDLLELGVLDGYLSARKADTLYRSEDWASSWVTLTTGLNTGALNAMDADAGNLFRKSLGHSVALVPEGVGMAIPGSTISYTHLLINMWDADDVYDLAVSPPERGTVLTDNPVPLAPMGMAAVEISVSVPRDAVPGTLQRISLTATSRADPSVRAGVFDTTRVVSPHLVYLSTTLKND